MDELPLDQVRTLLAVVDEGTFDAAAAALHVTPSAVSQRVKALEQRTGRVLLMRTKPVRATESGEVVVRFARQLARLERDARAELGMADGMGPVRLPIAVNADSLATWFLPALARVPQDPPVCLELHREDESHTTALLREGQVMAAVTSSPDPVAGCSVRMLGLVRYLPVASPAFAARYLTGEPERDLREAPTIVFDRKDDLQDAFVRGLTGDPAIGAGPVRHYIPTSEGFRDAVVAGLGWGLVPEQQSRPLVRAGQLVLLEPLRPMDVPLYWQQWRLDSPALSTVAEVIAAAARESLRNPRPEPDRQGPVLAGPIRPDRQGTPKLRTMESYTIGQAARLLGVSVDTARRWADAERFPTHREGTRRMVDGPDLAAFCVEAAQEGAEGEEVPYTSARNAFPGIVTGVKLGTVDAQVEIQAGPHRIVSLLTREAVEELGLEVGARATARVKSTSVFIDRV